MKKSLYVIISGLFLLTGCMSHDIDEPQPQPNPNVVSQEEINENLKNVFGMEFGANHNWSSTTSGKVNVNVDPSLVERVQVVVVYESGVDSEGKTLTETRVLNEAWTKNRSSIELKYDAPASNVGLYVFSYTKTGFDVRKIEGSSVDFKSNARTRATQTETVDFPYTLPKDPAAITSIIPSYASERFAANAGEKLYLQSGTKVSKPSDYDVIFKSSFDFVMTYFPNGRGHNNLSRVKQTGYINESFYPFTTGKLPIIVSPVYKYDSAEKWGNEVYNSDLYYYYFKASDVENMTEEQEKAYLKSLPKYKALSFSDWCGPDEDNFIRKSASYALVYYDETKPVTEGTTGSFYFPEGYKVGFMVRANTTYEAPKKNGECYGDGRLNDQINGYGNFASSKLDPSDPRMAWLNVGPSGSEKLMLCVESGTDADYNDIVMEVEGGITGINVIPDPDFNVYTYCYEDREIGDYDLNDIVIKAVWEKRDKDDAKAKVKYYLVACGAYDELYINQNSLFDFGNYVEGAGVEVHKLFGVGQKVFVNTDMNQQKLDYVESSIVLEVGDDFSFAANPPVIYNKTQDRLVTIATTGPNPYGLLIPIDFKYPKEKVSINKAYPLFCDWSKDWYYPENAVLSNCYTK